MPARLTPDYTELARARSAAAARLHDALEHIDKACNQLERAAVAMTGADLPADGALVAVRGDLSTLRLTGKRLLSEQSEMVDLYADALRRAEGQAA